MDGVTPLRKRGLGASQMKNIRRKALTCQLTDTGLMRRERNGGMAKCILVGEIPAVLEHLHDRCGHFCKRHYAGWGHWASVLDTIDSGHRELVPDLQHMPEVRTSREE